MDVTRLVIAENSYVIYYLNIYNFFIFINRLLIFIFRYLFGFLIRGSRPGVANRGTLRQIWRIACLEVAHSRFKIFRAIWESVLSSGRKICQSNNISKKKKNVRTWMASRLVAYLSQK